MNNTSRRRRSQRTLRPLWRVSNKPFAWGWLIADPPASPDPRSASVMIWRPYSAVVGMVALLTLACWQFRPLFNPINTDMLYIIPVLVAAIFLGLWPSMFAAALGVFAFDFFFIPPLYSYSVSDFRYVIALGVDMAVGTVTALLAASLKRQAENALKRERVTLALFSMVRQMADAPDLHTMMTGVAQHVAQTLGMPASLVLIDDHGKLSQVFGHPLAEPPTGRASDRLTWVYEHGQSLTFGEKAEPELIYLPLKTEEQIHGVLCVGAYGEGLVFSAESLAMTHAVAGLTAVSIARWRFQETAQLARLSAESERLRTALLDSISHELRTPLTSIMGAASSLNDNRANLTAADQTELLETLRGSAVRMNRLVLNLLSMVRIESDMVSLNPAPCDVSETVGMALHQLREPLRHHPIRVDVADNLTVVGDQGWLQQVLVNLISNAAKYSDPESPIEVVARGTGSTVRLEVKDSGQGIAPADYERVFDKFYRGTNGRNIPGTGLGLAICKSIVLAHQGSIRMLPNHPCGTIVSVELPAWEESAFEELLWNAKS